METNREERERFKEMLQQKLAIAIEEAQVVKDPYLKGVARGRAEVLAETINFVSLVYGDMLGCRVLAWVALLAGFALGFIGIPTLDTVLSLMFGD